MNTSSIKINRILHQIGSTGFSPAPGLYQVVTALT